MKNEEDIRYKLPVYGHTIKSDTADCFGEPAYEYKNLSPEKRAERMCKSSNIYSRELWL